MNTVFRKWIFSLFLLSSAHADVVDRLFDWYKISYEDLKSVPTTGELERFFCPDFCVISNGVEVCSSCQEYVDHFSFLKQNCRSAKTSPFLEEPIRVDDKVIVRYNAEIEDKSERTTQLQIIAILTLREDKIAKWVEVLHETNPIYWK